MTGLCGALVCSKAPLPLPDRDAGTFDSKYLPGRLVFVSIIQPAGWDGMDVVDGCFDAGSEDRPPAMNAPVDRRATIVDRLHAYCTKGIGGLHERTIVVPIESAAEINVGV